VVVGVLLAVVLLAADDDTSNSIAARPSSVMEKATTTTEGQETVSVPSTSPTLSAEPTTLPPGVAIGDVIFDPNQVVPGMCVDDSNFGVSETIGTLTVADCTVPHDVEVYVLFDISGPAGSPFPGDASLLDQGEQGCREQFAGYVGVDYLDSSLEFGYLYPSEETWRKYDDRVVVCYLYDVDLEPLIGSMAGSGR
jgi:hypothetical protein